MFDFLRVLNPSTPNNIKLSNLQLLDTDKAIVFTGSTASFETLNVFVDTLKSILRRAVGACPIRAHIRIIWARTHKVVCHPVGVSPV